MESSLERNLNAGPLKLRVTQVGETVTVQLSGELDLSNVGTVEREIQDALAGNSRGVVIDISELNFIDSTGIALLISASGESNGDGRLAFVRSQAAAVNRILELTGVADRLPYLDRDQLSR